MKQELWCNSLALHLGHHIDLLQVGIEPELRANGRTVSTFFELVIQEPQEQSYRLQLPLMHKELLITISATVKSRLFSAPP